MKVATIVSWMKVAAIVFGSIMTSMGLLVTAMSVHGVYKFCPDCGVIDLLFFSLYSLVGIGISVFSVLVTLKQLRELK